MWKYVTRGIRETLERRVCRTNIYSQSSQDGTTNTEIKTSNFLCHQKFLAPNFTSFGNGFFGSNRTKPKPKREESKWETKYNWVDAVGWSSLLAIGWVVCQSLCLHRKLFEKENRGFKSWKENLSIPAQVHISRLLSHFLIPHPRYGLPMTSRPVVCAGTEQIFEHNPEITEPHGPLTVEEALAEAVDKFTETHQLLSRELEFSFGNRALKENRYHDAIKHFTEGAKMLDAGSTYNLALCHQLGLGTTADSIKAVKYYTEAAEMGHPDALYNLGVFHAQGMGGLSTNLVKAKQFFVKAANLGQIQAQKALLMEKNFKEESEKLKKKVKKENTKGNIIMQFMKYRNILNTNLENSPVSDKECLNSNKLSSETYRSPTDMFLETLGIYDRSSIPMIRVGESGH